MSRAPTFKGAPSWPALAAPARRASEPPTAEPAVAKPSLAELYDAHSDFVYRSLLGLGVAPSRAEDAMQDVFLVANQHLSKFEGSFYRAWLFKLSCSVARNARRATRRTDGTPIDELQLVDVDSSPFDRAARAEQVRLLHSLLVELDDGQREVFILAELEQLAHVEIAAALGVHVNTVANRLKAARERLERSLRKHRQAVKPEGSA